MSLYDPRSVAVVGASDDPAKWGYWLARGALAGRARREVHLVSRRGGTVLGERCHTSLVAAECVVVCVPGPGVLDVVREGLALGVRHFICITAGVTDEEGLAETVRAGGARLLGPNCMGVVDAAAELNLSWGDFPAGAVGLVSQSGNLGLEVRRLLARAGHGLSRFVSVGNQRDIDVVEALGDLVDHEPTRLIACYVEGVRDGRRLVETASLARAAGKPVLLLTVGGSEAGGQAAASHTGALVSALDVVDAACRAAGAVRVATPGELVDAAQVLLGPARPAGGRVAIAGDSGGQGAIAADVFSAVGLGVPALPEAAAVRVRELLPAYAGVRNPVDLAGAGEADLSSYARLAEVLLAQRDLDSVVLTGYFGDYAVEAEVTAARRMAAAARTAGKPLVVHTMAGETPAVVALREAGVPVVPRIEQAAAGLGTAVRWATAPPPRSLPVPPRAAAPVAGGGYWTIRRRLAAAGLVFPEGAEVHDVSGALATATEIGFPVVLKAMGLAHKTEAGGVRLGLPDEAALRRAYAEMAERTGARTFSVERMAATGHGVELIAGVRRDPAYGPVVAVGAGGVTAELAADTTVELGPVDLAQAARMLRRLRCFPLLQGWRGGPPADLDGIARVLAVLSRFAAAHPEVREVELNPILAGPRSVVALDAHAIIDPAPPAPPG